MHVQNERRTYTQCFHDVIILHCQTVRFQKSEDNASKIVYCILDKNTCPLINIIEVTENYHAALYKTGSLPNAGIWRFDCLNFKCVINVVIGDEMSFIVIAQAILSCFRLVGLSLLQGNVLLINVESFNVLFNKIYYYRLVKQV